jgi:hypothetical protein
MISSQPKVRTTGDQWRVPGASGPEKQLLDHEANKIILKGTNPDNTNNIFSTIPYPVLRPLQRQAMNFYWVFTVIPFGVKQMWTLLCPTEVPPILKYNRCLRHLYSTSMGLLDNAGSGGIEEKFFS